MELNTEINKVFGTEMARIFASTISEDEIKEKAQAVWTELNQGKYEYGRRYDPKINEYIRDVILEKLHDKIVEILKEPINEEKLEAKAREMVEEARKVGEKLIIKQISENIANSQLYSSRIMSDDIVTRVMSELNAKKENQRGW